MNRFYPDHPIIGVGAVMICDKKILLSKRKNYPEKGKWSIPGGIVELGERISHTVIREVYEETGLEVYSPQLIDVVDSISLDKNNRVKYHFVIVVFRVMSKTSLSDAQALSDAEEIKLVPFSEVENYNLTGSFKRFWIKNQSKL